MGEIYAILQDLLSLLHRLGQLLPDVVNIFHDLLLLYPAILQKMFIFALD